MSEAAQADPDDVFTAELDQYFRSLTSGVSPCEETTGAVPPAMEGPIRDAKACLDVLHQMARKRRRTNGRISAPSLPSQIGRFQIRSQLGVGGFGVVYCAYDPATRREVALKVPRLDVFVSPELRSRFELEAAACAKLDHPNIVPVLEAGVADGIPYMAAPFYAGTNLAQWMRANPTEHVVPKEAAQVVRQLAEAVHHAHEHGVLHRDIKPSNVLLTGGGEREPLRSLTPRLMDFGLAKLSEASGDITRSGAILGTVRYMSPEQARGDSKSITTATDIYGIGTVLYELLTGRVPFEGNNDVELLRRIESEDCRRPRSFRPAIPIDLDTICTKCLHNNPRSRYRSAAELAADLDRYLKGVPILARPTSPLERAVKWSTRNPYWASLLALLLFVLISFLSVLSYSNQRISAALALERQSRAELQVQLYSADLRRADEALKHHDPHRAKAILEPYSRFEEGRDLREFSWHLLWNSMRDHHVAVPKHPDVVYSISLSPNGKQLATGGRDGVVRLWDRERSELVWSFRCDQTEVNQVGFSPDGRFLAAARQDGRISVWETEIWKTPFTFEIGGIITTDHRANGERIFCVVVQPNGKIVAVGVQNPLDGEGDFALARYKSNGVLDESFGDGGIFSLPWSLPDNDAAFSAACQPDHKLVVAGHVGDNMAIFRLTPDGSADADFGVNGLVMLSLGAGQDSANCVALQPDGKIVVAGQSENGGGVDIAVVRLNADGSKDATFGDGGHTNVGGEGGIEAAANAVAIDPNGRVIVAGYASTRSGGHTSRDVVVACFGSDGRLDPSFADCGVFKFGLPTTDDIATELAVQHDGKILVAATVGPVNDRQMTVTRVLRTGTLDASFGDNGTARLGWKGDIAHVRSVAQQADGKVVVAGTVYRPGGQRKFALGRFNEDGSADTGFGDNGRVALSVGPANAELFSISIQADGKIVAGGYACCCGGLAKDSNFVLARFHVDGELDRSFSSNGAAGLAFSPDSKRLYAHGDQCVQLWDLGTGTQLHQGFVSDGDVESISVSSDGEWFGAATSKRAFLWRTTDLNLASTIVTAGHSDIRSFTYLPGTSHVALGLGTQKVDIKDRVTDERLQRIDVPSGIDMLRSSGDGHFLAVVEGNFVEVLRTDTWEQVAEVIDPTGRVFDVAFDSKSPTILTSNVEGQVAEWSLLTDELPYAAHGSREVYRSHCAITAWAVSSNDAFIACGHEDGLVKVVEADSGCVVYEAGAPKDSVQSVVFSKDCSKLWVAHSDGTVFTIDIRSKSVVRTWSAKRALETMVISPNEDRIAIACSDRPEIILSTWPEGVETGRVDGQTDVSGMVFSPAGSELVTFGHPRLDVIDVLTAAVVTSHGKLGESYSDVRFFDRGAAIAVAEGGRGYTLRDFPSCRIVSRLQGHEGGVHSLCVTPEGRNFATFGTSDRAIRLWDRLTLEPVVELPDLGAAGLGSLRFTNDGQRLIAVCQAQTRGNDHVLIWSARPSRN